MQRSFPRLYQSREYNGTCSIDVVGQDFSECYSEKVNVLTSTIIGAICAMDPFPGPPMPQPCQNSPQNIFDATLDAILLKESTAKGWYRICQKRLELAGNKRLGLYLVDKLQKRYPLPFPGAGRLNQEVKTANVVITVSHLPA